jgi:hypothetical protein
MTAPVLLTFDLEGPGGVPGALRTAAATFPEVWVRNDLALRIARDLEAVQAVRDDLAQERAVRAMLQESVLRIASEVERRALWSLVLGLACGLCLGGAVLWAVLA